jgi:peroxiredoxin Q/BCP
LPIDPSAPASPEPPPLDTNWQHDPGHLLSQGDRAPDFEGIAHTGMRVKLSRFLGKPVVVYFCSKDASPEGTAEARGYRDNWMRFNEKVGIVLGVTTDDRATHYDFATGERLPFLLVADELGHIARAFGVGAEGRTTVAFVVDPDGKISRVFSEGGPEGQYSAVVKALESQ